MPMIFVRWRVVLATAGLAAATFAAAQPALPPQPGAGGALAAEQRASSWASLTPLQRSALAPLQQDWDSLDATRQSKWLGIARRFSAMSPQEQARVQHRMDRWAGLSAEARSRARLQFQQTRQLSPQERRAAWEAYQELPLEERRELAKQATAAAASKPGPSAGPVNKSSLVHAPAAVAVKPVGPTLVQAAPGATTTSVTRHARPPLYQQPGLPKLAATSDFVDKLTLLPKRGVQAAAMVPSAADAQAAAVQ